MTLTIKTICLYLAVFLTGLSAGLFYAWAVSVIPGTRKVPDLTYLQTMQSINKEILNPVFFLSFFGSLVMLVVSTIQQYHHGTVFWLMLAAVLTYFIGTFFVTAIGNVPLNNELEALNLKALSEERITQFRQYYQFHWNRWHSVRTWCSILSFLLALAAVFNYKS